MGFGSIAVVLGKQCGQLATSLQLVCGVFCSRLCQLFGTIGSVQLLSQLAASLPEADVAFPEALYLDELHAALGTLGTDQLPVLGRKDLGLDSGAKVGKALLAPAQVATARLGAGILAGRTRHIGKASPRCQRLLRRLQLGFGLCHLRLSGVFLQLNQDASHVRGALLLLIQGLALLVGLLHRVFVRACPVLNLSLGRQQLLLVLKRREPHVLKVGLATFALEVGFDVIWRSLGAYAHQLAQLVSQKLPPLHVHKLLHRGAIRVLHHHAEALIVELVVVVGVAVDGPHNARDQHLAVRHHVGCLILRDQQPHLRGFGGKQLALDESIHDQLTHALRLGHLLR